MSRVTLDDASIDRLTGDVAVAFFFEDERPLSGHAGLLDWRLDGRLTTMLLSNDAVGRAGELILIGSNGKVAAPWVLFVGGGSLYGLSEETLNGLVRYVVQSCLKAGFRQVAFGPTTPEDVGEKALTGLIEASLADLPGESGWVLASGSGAGDASRATNC